MKLLIMKLLLSSVLFVASAILTAPTFGGDVSVGWDLNNYKITSVEVRSDSSVEVVFDQTDDSLGKHGTLKAQIGKKELQGPVYQAVLAAYTSRLLIDGDLVCSPQALGMSQDKNSIRSIKIKITASPDGK